MVVEFQYDSKRREVKIISDYFSNIREAFSVKNQAARFNPYSKWMPQRIYAITPSGYCGLGLVPDIVAYLKTLNIPFEVAYNKEYTSIIENLKYHRDEIKVAELKELSNEDFKLRPYQIEAVRSSLNAGYGCTVVGTGGGKTFIMATLLLNVDFRFGKALIIVPDIGLVDQTYNDFILYGISPNAISKWTGEHDIDLSKNIIIANLGILQSKISDLDWFKHITVLVVDECHKLRRGNKVNNLLDKIHTFNRFGFTGTLPENNIDKWNILGQIGPVIYELSTSGLRAAGEGKYISNAQVLALHIEYDKKPDYTAVAASLKYRTELDFIYANKFRYNVVKNIANKIKNNCLILVDHIEHGEKMLETLQTLEGKAVYFIQGSVEVEERQKIQKLMEEHNNIICIAISKIFSTGISIKNIHYIVFAAGGKSKIKTLQSIGRGLRVHASKEVLTIIDLVDELVYGGKHFAKREQFYDLEQIKINHGNITEK